MEREMEGIKYKESNVYNNVEKEIPSWTKEADFLET
jgi:hypothetical protein